MPIAINGSGTITGLSAGGLPDGCITTDDLAAGAATPAKLSQPLTLGTAVATTSGTAIDFTGIPSWVKRITVMFNDISTNGTSYVVVRLGTSGGVVSAGYTSFIMLFSDANTSSGNSNTTGFHLATASTTTFRGTLTIYNISGNTWLSSGTHIGSTPYGYITSGNVTLSSALTQLRLTTVSGDTFDAGSVNIMYE